MSDTQIVFLQNLFTFLGIAILALPVLSLDGRRKKLRDVTDLVEDRAATGDTPAMDRIGRILKDKRGRDVADWRLRDRAALWGGYVMLLGASGSRLVWP